MTGRPTDEHAPLQPWDFGSLDLFRGVGYDAIGYLVERCAIRSLTAGELLLAKGDDNQALYLVIDGALSVHLDSPDTAAVAIIGSGGCIGELSLIDHQSVSAHVVARRDCRVLIVPEGILWRLVHISHQIACNLLGILSQRLRSSNLLIADGQEQLMLAERSAAIDELTGVYNKNWIMRTLWRLVMRCRHDRHWLSLVMLDIDHFKRLNDERGHLAGDRALTRLGRILSDHIRPRDVVARFGGEEFLVVLPETSLDEAERIAERLRLLVAATPVEVAPNETVTMTVSLGIAGTPPDREVAPEDLLAEADRALYQAKGDGRNRVGRADGRSVTLTTDV